MTWGIIQPTTNSTTLSIKLIIIYYLPGIFAVEKLSINTVKALVRGHLGNLKKVVITRAGSLPEWPLVSNLMVKQ